MAAGVQVLVPSSVAVPCALAGSWVKRGATETPASAQMGCWCHSWLLYLPVETQYFEKLTQGLKSWQMVESRFKCGLSVSWVSVLIHGASLILLRLLFLFKLGLCTIVSLAFKAIVSQCDFCFLLLFVSTPSHSVLSVHPSRCCSFKGLTLSDAFTVCVTGVF